MTIKQVTAEGFTVIVEMDDGNRYPFRTHPEAAKLFATALVYREAVRQLLPIARRALAGDDDSSDLQKFRETEQAIAAAEEM